jgi:hypothetical protein
MINAVEETRKTVLAEMQMHADEGGCAKWGKWNGWGKLDGRLDNSGLAAWLACLPYQGRSILESG